MPLLALRAIQSEARVPDEVSRTKEVAAMLEFAQKAICAMAQAGWIPTRERQWRVHRTETDPWIYAQPREGDDEGGRGE